MNETATTLREAWLERKQVCLTLTDRCQVPIIVGRVNHVSVTSAHTVVDGWMVPVAEILTIARPTVGDLHQYADVMREMRKEANW
jgi:hypothetical protein